MVASSIDSNGRPWGSFIAGPPGFVRILSPQSIAIQSLPPKHDRLFRNLEVHNDLGLLAIEFAARRRMKIKGYGRIQNGVIRVEIERVYALCPKYIQAREVCVYPEELPAAQFVSSRSLSGAQQLWIGKADTFFLATHHPETGGDATHRGGLPGFVKVLSPSQLQFPDYEGNHMFNSLGNIHVSGKAGMLLLDFAGNRTLQITGRAEILWNQPGRHGSERAVSLRIEDVIEMRNAYPLSWRLPGNGRCNVY